jgi:16S rRNA processing protein RimM
MERFVVGFVRSPHGLAGNFKFLSASGEYAHFADMREVTLKDKARETTYAIEHLELSAAFPTMKLAGVDSPEAAQKLNGCEIIVPRDKGSPLREGEFYVEDLKQCVLVYNAPGCTSVEAGIITGVLEGGADDLLEVAITGCSNQSERTCLVPFNKVFIGDVDIARKRVELRHLWILE